METNPICHIIGYQFAGTADALRQNFNLIEQVFEIRCPLYARRGSDQQLCKIAHDRAARTPMVGMDSSVRLEGLRCSLAGTFEWQVFRFPPQFFSFAFLDSALVVLEDQSERFGIDRRHAQIIRANRT
jgi:hypothetical protein